VLNPAHIVLEFAGLAMLKTGATGDVDTGHVTIVTGPVAVQP
jgi:hypothetical protein